MAKISSSAFYKVLLIVVCAIAIDPVKAVAAEPSAIRILLNRAQTQAQSGHMNIAVSTWQQVLASDPARYSLCTLVLLTGHFCNRPRT